MKKSFFAIAGALCAIIVIAFGASAIFSNSEAEYTSIDSYEDFMRLYDESKNEILEGHYELKNDIAFPESTKLSFTATDMESMALAATLSNVNPFTYRGYCYDYDIELYYLQSRYYSPEIGRFINTDDTQIAIATQGEILGANLFAYCNNNPVNYADYYGFASYSLSFKDFKSDWAGREILKHYLTGNGKAFYKSSSKWMSYMNKAPVCKICNSCKKRNNSSKYLNDYILKCIIKYKNKIEKAFYEMQYSNTIKVDASVQNGESIIGYNYLHGANSRVGGLKIKFTLTKQKPKKSNEKYRIKIFASCVWNDMIDPNFAYSSDTYKAALATKIPFTNPKDYQLRISWYFTSTYIEYSKVSIK